MMTPATSGSRSWKRGTLCVVIAASVLVSGCTTCVNRDTSGSIQTDGTNPTQRTSTKERDCEASSEGWRYAKNTVVFFVLAALSMWVNSQGSSRSQ